MIEMQKKRHKPLANHQWEVGKHEVSSQAGSHSAAKDLTVAITDPKKQEAMVIADGDNFSLAIGKKGQNARLATRLTKFRKIDIKTTEQAREAGINFR